jgi:hypothetical protein
MGANTGIQIPAFKASFQKMRNANFYNIRTPVSEYWRGAKRALRDMVCALARLRAADLFYLRGEKREALVPRARVQQLLLLSLRCCFCVVVQTLRDVSSFHYVGILR